MRHRFDVFSQHFVEDHHIFYDASGIRDVPLRTEVVSTDTSRLVTPDRWKSRVHFSDERCVLVRHDAHVACRAIDSGFDRACYFVTADTGDL